MISCIQFMLTDIQNKAMCPSNNMALAIVIAVNRIRKQVFSYHFFIKKNIKESNLSVEKRLLNCKQFVC